MMEEETNIINMYEKALDQWYSHYKRPSYRFLLLNKEYISNLVITALSLLFTLYFSKLFETLPLYYYIDQYGNAIAKYPRGPITIWEIPMFQLTQSISQLITFVFLAMFICFLIRTVAFTSAIIHFEPINVVSDWYRIKGRLELPQQYMMGKPKPQLPTILEIPTEEIKEEAKAKAIVIKPKPKEKLSGLAQLAEDILNNHQDGEYLK
jgi:hypothetical protein